MTSLLQNSCSKVNRFVKNCGRRAKYSYSTNSKGGHYQIVVVGGGAGGSSISNALGRKLGKHNVAVVEPNDVHYYQPMWTLIGAGAKQFHQCHRPTSQILTKSTWIQDSVTNFDPTTNRVVLKSGQQLQYDILIVALGLNYDTICDYFLKIKGLPDAFSTPGVCSNYHQDYVLKTLTCIQNFRSGNAIFTFPQTSIKCPGAPQKIMYLAEDNFKKTGKRDTATMIYCTASNFMFGCKAYNRPLEEICDKKGITRNYRHSLTEIKPGSKEALFDIKDADGKLIGQKCWKYEMIHVSPPCSAPEVLRKQVTLVDQTGYLNLNKETLQHEKFSNIFGLGDCTNLPASKTAAAACAESGVLQKNVIAFLENRPLLSKYNGYASCPLVTSYNTAIMPEFDYSMTPLERCPSTNPKNDVYFTT